jgi:hypothetical protein
MTLGGYACRWSVLASRGALDSWAVDNMSLDY